MRPDPAAKEAAWAAVLSDAVTGRLAEATAEGLLDAPLATLDSRLANSPGPRCQFLLPPASNMNRPAPAHDRPLLRAHRLAPAAA